ncbi:pirin family protein [Gordonia sp. NB41Y]|uniref:pirin family protein n=1 Tax=Gordonia sp. NB41Y TaxID=875808 RepID=UPI0002BDF8B7|nr:pirin family protein [Gordonia sp. NB41Y]EMP13890.1 pirin [Gordonia sp. NB41Y]WLP91718.1 pirin family protein [Gordonia sp. NB41Y]
MTTPSTPTAGTPGAAGIRVIRSDERHRWDDAWLTSRQSFPATGNFDLRGNAHGLLMVSNDDVVDPAEGFDTHEHVDVEIVTWVVEGALAHRDSRGNAGVLTPGVVQRMTAGTGITHSERNGSSRADAHRLRVVQMWLATEYAGHEPGYAERDVTDRLATGELFPVVSGLARHRGTDALDIANSHVALHAARPVAGTTLTLPAARFGHLYVVRGSVELSGGAGVAGGSVLSEGDAARTTDQGELRLTATTDAEILFWEMERGFA